MNPVAAVVVTYNRKEMLATCIRKLREQEGAACDILVIDNASMDGTEAMIHEQFLDPSLHYFNTGANLGGAGGFSFGMRKAVEMGYTWIWAMDDDTYAEPDALQELLKADRQLSGNYGFLSGMAFWTDGCLCSMNRQHTSLRGRLNGNERDLTPVMMATFVSFFVKAETVREFGLPIKEFVIWTDDLEYSRRISRRLPCYAVPSSKVVHAMANNQKVGIEYDSPDRLWRYEKMYRNEVYVYRREGLRGLIFLFLRVNLHRARVLLHADSRKKEKLRVIGKSFRSGFRFHPETEYIN
jgi:GT2 family glycosyltransferase